MTAGGVEPAGAAAGGPAAPAPLWSDARLAAELLSVDPFLLGGLLLRSWPGPPRDRVVGWVRSLLPAERPMLRLPLHVTEDRLLGGLSLADTLRHGSVVAEQGLLARADGGVVVAAMAERIEPRVGSHLCAALDSGQLVLERDGISAQVACRFGVLALDEGIGDEVVHASLRDRLAIWLDVSALTPGSAPPEAPDPARVLGARRLLPEVVLDEDGVSALCAAAVALGIPSLRAPVLAAGAARIHAALEGRTAVEEADLAVAARLVLGPRATRVPDLSDDDEQEAPPPEEEPPPPPPPDAEEPPPEPPSDESPPEPEAPLDDVVLEAARSGIPAGLLDSLVLGLQPRGGARSAGHAGALRSSTEGGRPAGVRPGPPRTGERINVVETLRAAAPWQRVRGRAPAHHGHAGAPRRLEIRKEDFRVTRFRQRTQTSVIFSVDASGSAAMQRLAEAKGAVEQVLSDCYVRRDHVALIAFRGTAATLLLAPTRSLVRVRRGLADLAGGGTTPLAAGIEAALHLAYEARKRGHTPVLVLMTDGRANVARDGKEGRAAADADATVVAREVRAAGIRALFLDTAPRPQPAARALAAEMGARYLPLPYLDAVGISTEVQRLAEDA